jgi:hypothetical protein
MINPTTTPELTVLCKRTAATANLALVLCNAKSIWTRFSGFLAQIAYRRPTQFKKQVYIEELLNVVKLQ